MLRIVLLVLAGALSLALGYGALAPGEEEAPSPPADAAAPVELRRAAPPEAGRAGEVVTRTVRNVTPTEITAGPTPQGPLTRVAPPPEPPGEPAAPQARTERLFNPIIASAGVIKARGHDIRLAGITAPDFEARCGEGAASWPCGRMARAALRRFVRGRAVECVVPAGASDIPDPAECSVGGQNLAEWLVAQGWAKRAGDAFAAREAEARDKKLGLWGDGRPDAQADAASGAASAPDSALAISPRVSATP